MYQFQDDMLYADNINMFLLIRFAASLLLLMELWRRAQIYTFNSLTHTLLRYFVHWVLINQIILSINY